MTGETEEASTALMRAVEVLKSLGHLREDLFSEMAELREEAIPVAIIEARTAGVTWARIAEALGMGESNVQRAYRGWLNDQAAQ